MKYYTINYQTLAGLSQRLYMMKQYKHIQVEFWREALRMAIDMQYIFFQFWRLLTHSIKPRISITFSGFHSVCFRGRPVNRTQRLQASLKGLRLSEVNSSSAPQTPVLPGLEHMYRLMDTADILKRRTVHIHTENHSSHDLY